MEKRKLIVFDIDGTLTDSVKIHHEAFYTSLHELGVEHIDYDFKEYKHYTDSFIAGTIYEKDRNEAFSESKIALFEDLLLKNMISSSVKEIEGAKALLEFLKTQEDTGICFATGSLLRPAKFKLESIGVDFDESLLVASNDILERENIVQGAINNALEYYQVKEFSEIVSVGDGLWDLRTAANLNLDFIGIGRENREVLKTNGAKRLYDNLKNYREDCFIA